ncbi:MAG: TetR/AcrR family transcriptional regulator [Thermosynechococcaceae cyanobacterium]
MSEHSTETSQDPRVRRTRRLLQEALTTLLESKSFSDISITDICKQADIARVTFYQHYESREALLLASVTDFFASLHQTIDQDALDLYLEAGDMGAFRSTHQPSLVDPDQVRLVRVALQSVGAAVRKLTLASFLETYSRRETELTEKEIQVLATFYVGGMLTLMEQFLSGQLAISQVELQTATLTLLRASRQGVLQSNILLGDKND